ncbi:MAG: ERF family protein [archaeon]|nr:ERF family protein [archaeon]
MSDQIYTKIINVSRKIKPIAKDHKNKMQGYSFRGIDDMYNFLQPLLSEEGIFITSKIVNSEREERKSQKGGILIYSIIDMEFTFFAEDGSNISCITKGEAMDSGDKASNKAMSTALKYALLQMFMIPTEEKLDTENNSPDPILKEVRPNEKTKGDIKHAEKLLTQSTLKSFGVVMNELNCEFTWTDEERDKLRIICDEKKLGFKEVAK